MTKTLKDYLNQIIINTYGCWMLPVDTRSIRINKKMVSISRLVYEQYIGKLPYKSRIHRSCNNGNCLNPDHMLPSSFEDKFWRLVNKINNGCWEWIGAKDGGGYGMFRSPNFKEEKAHRISWSLFNGDIPINMDILHVCDNPPCVNPDHLFLGTNQDNINDKMIKNRYRPLLGKENGRCKLSEEEVRLIVQLNNNGVSYKKLAKMFPVGMTQIGRISRRESWEWLWD